MGRNGDYFLNYMDFSKFFDAGLKFKVTTEITAQNIVFQDVIKISAGGSKAFVAHCSHMITSKTKINI